MMLSATTSDRLAKFLVSNPGLISGLRWAGPAANANVSNKQLYSPIIIIII